MFLSVIILNYNGKQYLKDCLGSIRENTHDITYEVILVDNASTDGSVEYVKKEFPWVKVIENKENVGFSKGNNIGVKNANGKYVCILNNDTIILPNALNNLVNFMEEYPNNCRTATPQHRTTAALQHRNVATSHILASGKVLNFDGSLQTSCGKLPTLLSDYLDFTFCRIKGPNPLARYKNWNPNKISEVENVTGAFFVIRRDNMSNMGGFDENIFIFYEDADLCLRFLKSGGKIFYYPYSVIKHYRGGFFRTALPKGMSISYRSALYYFEKNFGGIYKCSFAIMVGVTSHILFLFFGGLSLLSLGRIQTIREKAKIFYSLLKSWYSMTPKSFYGRK